jgi:hypothetical protein
MTPLALSELRATTAKPPVTVVPSPIGASEDTLAFMPQPLTLKGKSTR